MRRSLRRCALASGPLLREVLRPYVETTCVARNDFTTNAAQLVELIGAKTVQRRGVQRLPRLDDRAAQRLVVIPGLLATMAVKPARQFSPYC